MNRERLVKDVAKKLTEITRYAKRIAKTHDGGDIHKLRVTYKKLRALLRMAHGNKHKAYIPDSLKEMYAAAGYIRDLQLHKLTVSDYFGQYNTLSVNYLQNIEDEIREQVLAFKAVYNDFSSGEAASDIQKNIPAKLHPDEVLRWFSNNKAEIQIIQNKGLTDNGIHEIRKYLKDLSYTKKYTADRKDYEEITRLLGDYMNKHVLLSLLETYIPKAPPVEIQMLEHARHRWLAEKEELKKQVITEITAMQ